MYERIRKLDSTMICDMDVYSTVLWQLKDDVALAALATELTQKHKYDDYLRFLTRGLRARNAPETWIAVGNVHSLKDDHVKALQYFETARSLDANSAYTHTLIGI